MSGSRKGERGEISSSSACAPRGGQMGIYVGAAIRQGGEPMGKKKDKKKPRETLGKESLPGSWTGEKRSGSIKEIGARRDP